MRNSIFIRTFIAPLLVAAWLSAGALAEGRWSLITSDFETQRVDLLGLDEQGVRILPAGDDEPRVVALDEFLQVDRFAPDQAPGGAFMLYLADGDRIAGDPVAMADEQLIWRNPGLEQITIELLDVVALHRHDALPAAPANDDAERMEDIITLMNRDRVPGIVIEITDSSIVVQRGADALSVPLDSIESVRFAAAGFEPEPPDDAPAVFRVRLADGSLLTSPEVALTDGSVMLSYAGESARTIDESALIGIEQVDGPVSWLSARQPAEDVQIPFLGQHWPTRMDRNVLGDPIRFGDQTYTRGIGVHAYSRLVYPLDDEYDVFRTRYAIDGEGPYANVTVRLLLDDRVVYEREDVVAGELSSVVEIELGDAQSLTLEVDYGQTFDVQDRFNWIKPALVRRAGGR